MTWFIIETKNKGNWKNSQYIPITVCVSKKNLAVPIFQRYNIVEEISTV